jgi:hypothetical protein
MGEVRAWVAELVTDWEEEGAERIWVQVVTGRPLAEVLPVVSAVVREVAERFDPDVIGAGEVLVFPGGPVVVVEYCDEREILVSWASELAAALGDHGLNGSVRLFDAHSSPHWLDDTPVVVPTLAGSIPVDVEAILADVDRTTAAPFWYVPEPVTGAVLDILVPWCLALTGGDTVRFQHSLQHRDVDSRDVKELLRLALAQHSRGDAGVTCGRSIETFRLLRFDIHGQFTVATADRTMGCAGQAAELARLLTRLAPHLENALIRLATPGRTWRQVVNPPVLPPRPPFAGGRLGASLLSDFRHLLGSRVFDAYGIQLLTDAHLAHARDLSGWHVETVAPGRHLVRARDLDAWYDGARPDLIVLEQARADFSDMILTAETLAAQPRPW